jgi:hypothetical protein
LHLFQSNKKSSKNSLNKKSYFDSKNEEAGLNAWGHITK